MNCEAAGVLEAILPLLLGPAETEALEPGSRVAADPGKAADLGGGDGESSRSMISALD